MYEGISYVLKKINLDLNKGEKVALVGESGSGKSVTTKLILGLLNQKNVTKKGKILFNDKKRKSAEKAQQTRRARQGEASISARESTPMEGLENDVNQKEIDYIASMLDNL